MKALLVVALVSVCTISAAVAAPVESVESARASKALQKVDAFLGEKAVAKQLQALGVTREQARARLAKLSEPQLETLAAQIDLVKAGGTIQGSGGVGPLGCMMDAIGRLMYNFWQFFFCWGDQK